MAEQSGNCLICGAPSSAMHFGINCCRPCSVFYKRTYAQSHKRPLRCKEGDGKCTSNKPKSICRKCRFERFTSILANSERKSTSDSEVMKQKYYSPEPSTSFEGSPQSDSPCSDTPILERLKKAYGALCEMRKNGEMCSYSSQIREELQQGTIKYAPATYTNVIPHAGILFAGLLDLFSTCFEDFKRLSNEKQQQLLFLSFQLMHRSEDIYRAVQYFPDDETFMPSYTTIFSIDNIDVFLSDCPASVNKEEASAEIIKNTQRTLVVNKAHFKRIQLTIEEFLAFLGLALWRDHKSINDEDMIEMAMNNRSQLMAELHKYYAGKEISAYSARLGELLCLLVSMEELEVQHKEDQKVYALMNMFNEYLTL